MSRARHKRQLLVFAALALLGVVLVFFPLGRHPRASAAPAGSGAPKSAPKASASARLPATVTATVTSAAPPPAPAEDRTAIPRGRGLPVAVHVAVAFVDVASFDDTKGEFEGTVDVRLRWRDPRSSYEDSPSIRGQKEWRGKAAESELEKMWAPVVTPLDQIEPPEVTNRRLRIFSDGEVESLVRTRGKYKTSVDAEQFPFDRQFLTLTLVSLEETTAEVKLEFDRTDVEFSAADRDMKLDGWQIGLVDLKASQRAGWDGDRYPQIVASLFVDRNPTTGLGPIFIPLVASLLIPLLAVWMNRSTEEGFEIAAFELANMGIGGLFSVIALSFAVYSSFTMLASGDNTVTRLFGLNYAMLSLALAIVVLLYRYNLLLRLFGPYVQREAFRFLAWAMPLVTLSVSLAFILVAAA